MCIDGNQNIYKAFKPVSVYVYIYMANVNWNVVTTAKPYNNASKRCNLYLTEKLHIIKCSDDDPLNKRSELVSKCRHENKYYAKNFENGVT